MKQVARIVIVFLSLYAGASLAQDFPYQANSFDTDYDNLIRLSLYGEREALLERKQVSFGTILQSHHFSDDEFNESHNGIYFEVDGWTVGTYQNSYYRDSVFFTYNSDIYNSNGLKFSFVTGLADGYANTPLAQDDYLPILGLSAQMKNLKAMLIYDVLVFGLEFKMN